MADELFEAALGVCSPWQLSGTDFDAASKTLTIRVDFIAGSHFALAGVDGQHPVHDTVAKRYRHLNFTITSLHFACLAAVIPDP
jgi:hypothetical protein